MPKRHPLGRMAGMKDMATKPRASLPTPGRRGFIARLALDLAGSRRFQSMAARLPGLRRIARGEGEAMMDLLAGFVNAQVLLALVDLNILTALRDGPQPVDVLAARSDVPPQRMAALLQAGAALGLLSRGRDGGAFDLAPRGAALLAVPGVVPMIRHHGAFYRDMSDPVALLRGEAETELAQVWPYVFGAGAAEDPARAAVYSQLMADSQALVAEETLATVSFRGIRHLLDVGGGTGAFLSAVLQRTPELQATLFDLPAVLPGAEARLAEASIADRVTLAPGSFREDLLPRGADAISLVRVLYDHADDTVADLLAACRAALPSGGQLIVTEPMTGGAAPHRAGDVYFAFYCMAMRTGRARSQAEIAAACAAAGFTDIRTPRARRRFLTSVVTARVP